MVSSLSLTLTLLQIHMICSQSAVIVTHLALTKSSVSFATKSMYHRSEAEDRLVEGKEQLEILKRQAVLGHLYPTARSVMETA